MDSSKLDQVQNLSVFAVIVLYKPQIERLVRLVSQLEQQVKLIVLVDNTEYESPLNRLDMNRGDQVRIIYLGRNMGIAFALNRGIEFCISQGAEFVVSFDQDSSITENFVAGLTFSYVTATATYGNIGCVGPNPVRSDGTSYYRNLQGEKHVVLPELITSGSLFSVQAFEKVGTFREDLFIDWVDFEWCWRASSLGYSSVLAIDVVMEHSVGSGDVNLFGSPVCAVSAPLRNYYQYRNFCYLFLRSNYFPLHRKLYFLCRRLGALFLILFFMRERRERLLFSMRGILHGLIGRLGAY